MATLSLDAMYEFLAHAQNEAADAAEEQRRRHLAWIAQFEAAVHADDVLSAAYVPQGAAFQIASVNGRSGLCLRFEPHTMSEYARLAGIVKGYLTPGLAFQVDQILEEEEYFTNRGDTFIYELCIQYGHRVVSAAEKMEN